MFASEVGRTICRIQGVHVGSQYLPYVRKTTRTFREQHRQVFIVQNHWRALYEGYRSSYVMDSMLNKSGKQTNIPIKAVLCGCPLGIHNNHIHQEHCYPYVSGSRPRLRVLISSRRGICFGPHQSLPQHDNNAHVGYPFPVFSGLVPVTGADHSARWAKFTQSPQL